MNQLQRLARNAATRAYSPYSGIRVGAAVEDDNGKIFTGCNIENASYGLTLCAERVAIAAAVAAGATRVARIAVVLDPEGEPVDYFDTLAWSIVSQQLSTKAAATIGQRAIALTDERGFRPEAIAAQSQERLRSAGLSNNKARFLLALANETLEGTLNFRSLAQMSDAAAIERLVQLKGIGAWTAQMFVMFAMRRPDVASPDDIGLQRAMHELYNLRKRPSKRRFLEIAQSWSPYRTIACWYLWRTVD